MAGLKLTNLASTLLASQISDIDTSIAISSGTGALFPSLGVDEWFPVVVVAANGGREIMRATDRTGDVITVTRAQEGTSAMAFDPGSRVDLRVTVAALTEFLQAPIVTADLNDGVLSADVAGRAKMADGYVVADKIGSNAVVTAKINDEGVTFAKMQHVDTDRLLGRDTADTGDVEALTVTAPLAFTGSGGITVSPATTIAAGVSELAIASEMVTGTDANRVPSVSVVHNHEGVAKAWGFVNFSGGTPSLDDSYGVTSIADTAAGRITVTLSRTMANTTYAVVATALRNDEDNFCTVHTLTTTTFVVDVRDASDGGREDVGFTFVVFGTLA